MQETIILLSLAGVILFIGGVLTILETLIDNGWNPRWLCNALAFLGIEAIVYGLSRFIKLAGANLFVSYVVSIFLILILSLIIIFVYYNRREKRETEEKRKRKEYLRNAYEDFDPHA